MKPSFHTEPFARTVSRKRARGAYVNTAEASCSIFESGRMVFRCLDESPLYDLDYYSLDNLDIELFHRDGTLRRLDGSGLGAGENYDFYVFNWHFITMASIVRPEAIGNLAGLKFTVVLELAPSDPLKLVPPNVFDGHIALDPAAQETDTIVPFPRPLEDDPWIGTRPNNSVPVIGSFGFGTPGKGFELFVEAVNREFDRAIVRVNIPIGTYVATDTIHDMPYAQRIADVCAKIAKPGIEVRFSNDFMKPEELVEWCAGNDLNCFMYTRAQPGLSATTDQCVISGQPLVTLTNDTFRHIHRYIPPYPMVGLRQAIKTSAGRVVDIQADWSKEAFRNTFHRMLARFDIVNDAGHTHRMRALEQSDQRIMVLSGVGAQPGNIMDHAQKVADALGRSGNRSVRHIAYGTAETLAEAISAFEPTACVLVGIDLRLWTQIGPLIERTIQGSKILITDHTAELQGVLGGAGTFLVPHQPIVPFNTTYIELLKPRSVWLIGFSANIAGLAAAVMKLRREMANADIIIEVPASERLLVEERLKTQAFWLSQDSQFRMRLQAVSSLETLHSLASSSLIVVHNEPARAAELEAYACLAMVTERPVVFTRYGAFPQFLGRGTYFEDHTTEELFDLGVAAHIKPYYDFGEWTFTAAILRLLDGSWREAVPEKAKAVVVALDAIDCLKIAAVGTGAKVEPPSPPVLPPAPPIVIDAATVLRPRGQGSTVFLLAGVIDHGVTRPSRFVVSLRETWRARGEPVQVVLWNPATKRLHLVNDDQWLQLSGPAARGPLAMGADSTPVLLDAGSCGPEDWLFVPEMAAARPGAYPLMPMNVVLEGRRLKLSSAFIFHGAEPLATPGGDPRAVDDHVHHMQALLLADLVLPVSDAAADDLQDFFVDHELADVVPLIRTVPWDAARYQPARAWSDYVRTLRARFTEAADPVRQLGQLYYLLPEPGACAPGGGFAQALAEALIDRGVTLVPVRWDAASRDLMRGEPPAGGPGAWGAWIVPGTVGAPSWLLVPHAVPGAELTALQQAVRAAGLRLAGLLTSARPDPAPGYFDALARLDKVLAGSAAQYDAFYRHLLASSHKVLSAEDRFHQLDLPTERATLRAGAPRRDATSVVRPLVHVATENAAELHALFAAVTQAIRQSPRRLKFTFVAAAETGHAVRETALAVALAAVPGARWEAAPDVARLEVLHREADFLVHAGPEGAGADAVKAAAWQGLPCLVLGTALAADFAGAGLVYADIRGPGEAAAELLKLADPEWRRMLATEALAQPVRTVRAYAEDLLNLLATDRLADGLIPAKRSGKPHIRMRLAALTPRPKLSLCISTYNRGGWVGLNLRNIFRQIPHPRADLEIVVVDNTSTDNTQDVVQPFLWRPDFRYVRNPRNVGMLGNLAVTAQQAQGDYLWIIGDDDLTRDGTIERVLQIISEQPRIELIYMNYGYSSEKDPGNVTDVSAYLDHFNQLEPAGPDEVATVNQLAAKSENFYTAIYTIVYRRDHGMRAYCQDTTERVFSTMLSCIPTSYYTLHYMAARRAYWIGQPAIVVNSNVSWQAYGTLFDLEQLPRTWDLAERSGCLPEEVDRRRSNRLWLVELMWRELFEDDRGGNAPYLSAARIIMRLKHLEGFRKHVPVLREIYVRAHRAGHPAAQLSPETLFGLPW